MKYPKEHLKTKDVSTKWKPCIYCSGELIQVRKALWTCLKCNKEFIACEEDMIEDGR